ncbi:MAG TPA: hypothetical protein VG457_07870 [Planctomycetota bacterium]|nr:hypothetical protein [Planctomycetota bacterium]
MVKLALAVLGPLAIAGCATYCSDGYSGTGVQIGPVGMSSSRYHACNDGCLDPVDPKPCGCSRACPCWGKHQ